jgi:hypothetical protein
VNAKRQIRSQDMLLLTSISVSDGGGVGDEEFIKLKGRRSSGIVLTLSLNADSRCCCCWCCLMMMETSLFITVGKFEFHKSSSFAQKQQQAVSKKLSLTTFSEATEKKFSFDAASPVRHL